jgi:hypothetical protein
MTDENRALVELYLAGSKEIFLSAALSRKYPGAGDGVILKLCAGDAVRLGVLG